MNLINQVYDMLKMKKSDSYCAERLGISLERYRSIKDQILSVKALVQEDFDAIMKDTINKKVNELLDENQLVKEYVSDLQSTLLSTVETSKEKILEFKEYLEDGTAEIKGIVFSEPQSADDIVRLLKIDTTKWKLSHYWNKQQANHWLVSAFVTRAKQDSIDFLKETLENFNPGYTPLPAPFINSQFSNPTVGILSIQDLHFGKEGNDGTVDDFKNSILDLSCRAHASHRLDKLYYVIGGDLLNMDTFGGSTTKGTPVDNSLRAQDAYNQAFDALYWSVNHLAQYCNELNVIYLPGNHDRLSSYHLAHALSKCFLAEKRIVFSAEYAERKVVVWGNNFFAFEHGDVNSKNTPLVYATEYPKEWGSTQYRTCYTGHWHRKKTISYVTEDEHHGFAIKHLPSLSKSDYWHYHNKFTGAKRQALMEIHDFEKGKISEFVYNA